MRLVWVFNWGVRLAGNIKTSKELPRKLALSNGALLGVAEELKNVQYERKNKKKERRE